ncbi:MAG: hypothetical protein ACJ8DC_09365 [Gemmatimonadales bacterium]
MIDTERQAVLLIDAHVHLHDCFQLDSFFEQAHHNFEGAAREHGWGPALGVLMLTESEGVDWFGRLAVMAAGSPADRGSRSTSWTVQPTRDPAALMAASGGRRLLLVAGRQVVAREGLEVLLLGTRSSVPDGRPIRDVLAEGARLGALRVIPWGAGKWLFGRGKLLNELIAAAHPGNGFFLGDGAGRPFFWTKPHHFDRAERRGLRILPGTDPLPFPRQTGRAGGFGLRLDGVVDLSSPAEGIKSALRDPASRLTPFGHPERLVPFVRNQIAMQRRKRGRRRP